MSRELAKVYLKTTYDPLMRTVEASSSRSGRKTKRSREAVSKQRGEYIPWNKLKLSGGGQSEGAHRPPRRPKETRKKRSQIRRCLTQISQKYIRALRGGLSAVFPHPSNSQGRYPGSASTPIPKQHNNREKKEKKKKRKESLVRTMQGEK